MPSTNTATENTSKSQLDDFLRRTNNADLHTAKPGAKDQEDWELVDEQAVLDDQDKTEWILVGKTEAEIRAQDQSKVVDMDKTAKRKHEKHQLAKRRMAKRARRMYSMSK
ncbi:hypothetical protein PtrSN002B_001083 [Pyrenophora tritici-repentis]|uniref:DUF641 domain containing protein n=2 Tax=Pyrenophora tritici-repentis TaxID=45151 RepID=A0A2W1G124_9PLEO|nr:uncharacterized protein PTRG_05759 [Pyrenophora tritici-repentis Pt-1C-BFP]KAA8618847.1 hypothetical protein PtrV1_08276 [Pyrenophora tritici-repentis]EDU48679.1 predicted protein [Pyrenophora tritici-repentis Pt-1C-BFP]KAF7449313.1 hypothetical protein A1F99_063620 [Pyrenophora tritici-repentis]KAF7570671.1 DUF641 domain containing protein [Pyrenophora tritici-repentis]KAG9383741.1 hypothetical protein A1F94_005652 [Pyrenophora tritici-repentis]